MNCDFWAILKNVTFQIKTALATYGKIWATFNFCIWPHWLTVWTVSLAGEKKRGETSLPLPIDKTASPKKYTLQREILFSSQ